MMQQTSIRQQVTSNQFEQQETSSQQTSSSGGGSFYPYPDLTFDNNIDFKDFAKLATNWHLSGTDLDGDFDGSGTVDFNDVAILVYYWLVPANWPIEVSSVVDANLAITNPVALAFDPNGNLYVLSSSQHQVKIYNKLSQLQTTIDVNAINPKGLAVNPNRYIYIADTGGNRILKCEPNGSPDMNFGTNGILGTTGSGNKQFSQPWGIALDGNGQLYVADSNNNRVQIFTPKGKFVTKWGQAGNNDGQLNTPSGLYALSNEDIFVSDTGNNRIQRFGAGSGYFSSKVGSFGSDHAQFKAPHGICYDIAFDQLIVADSNNNRIQIFQLHSYGGGGSQMTFAKAISDRSLSNPSAVASCYDPTDPNQVIFVADTGNNRVLRIIIQNDQQSNSPVGVFNTFKTALSLGDVDAAVACFAEPVQSMYSTTLSQLQSQFGQMVSDMGQMILISAMKIRLFTTFCDKRTARHTAIM